MIKVIYVYWAQKFINAPLVVKYNFISDNIYKIKGSLNV